MVYIMVYRFNIGGGRCNTHVFGANHRRKAFGVHGGPFFEVQTKRDTEGCKMSKNDKNLTDKKRQKPTASLLTKPIRNRGDPL